MNYRVDYLKTIAGREIVLWAIYLDAAEAAAVFDDLRDAGIAATLSARATVDAPWQRQFIAHGGAPVANGLPEDDSCDANIDAYHRGWDAHAKNTACPRDPIEGAGWRDRARAVRVQPVMPARPEGYYHAPLGTFE